MMQLLRHFLVVLVLLPAQTLSGQQTEMDSLLRVLKTQNDTLKAATYGDLAALTLRSDPQQSKVYAEKSVALARKTAYKWSEAFSLRLLGIIADESGDYATATARMEEALAINRAIKSRDGISACLSSLGLIYHNQSRYEDALRIYYETLPFYETRDLFYNRGLILTNISGILRAQKDYTGAKKYALEAVAVMQHAGSAYGEAIASNNAGAVYMDLDNKDSALYYMERGLALKRKMNDKRSIAASLGNLSQAYERYGEFDKAVALLEESIKIQEEINDRKGIAFNAVTAGNLLLKSTKPERAIDYFLKAYTISSQIGDLQTRQVAAFKCGNEYYNKGNYQAAADYIYVYSQLRDTLYAAEKNKSMTEMRVRYESDKQEQVLKMLNQENKLKALELEKALTDRYRKEQELQLLAKEKDLQQMKLEKTEMDVAARKHENELLTMDKEVQAARLQQSKSEEERLKMLNSEKARQLTYVLAGALLLIILLAVAINGYRQKRKANTLLGKQNAQIMQQKSEIALQKDIVDTKNKEITDSISYAKRLQDAILPPEKFWKNNLPESFIFYQPKDIVAGDFYWMEQHGNLLLFAAADCTGHGVPGAMVSVVCSNALNRTVNEFGITDPGKILDKVRELVIETFARSESEVNDGMDISLCVFDPASRKLHWAGANNPLWIVRDAASAVEEYAADKQPIGMFSYARPFQTQAVQLERNDFLFLFSDGYADQFGGPRGKKFKYKTMQQLFLENYRKPCPEQLELIRNAFFAWKGDLEQVDDVLVMGVRVL